MVFESLKFYRVNEVAERLRVSEDFIMELVVEGVLEGINLGNRGVWIIEERAILEFLCKNSNSIGKGISLDFLEEDLFDDNKVVVNRCKEIVVHGLEDGEIVSDLGKGDVAILKGDFSKSSEEDSVISCNVIDEGSVVTEFIFDEEQAKKPISDEILFSSSLDKEEKFCVGNDFKEDKNLLKNRGEGPWKSKSFGKSEKLISNTVVSGRVKRNFVISKFLIEQLQRVRDILGESMSSIVECALSMYFQSKGFISEHNFKR